MNAISTSFHVRPPACQTSHTTSVHALSFDWDVLVRRAEFNASRVADALQRASQAAHRTAATVAAAANNALGGNVQVQYTMWGTSA